MTCRKPCSIPARATAGALVLLLLASASAPLLRAGGEGIYDSLTLLPKDAALVKTSAGLEDFLRRRGGLLGEGPELALVRRVGEAVVPAQPTDDYQHFRFGVLRSPVPNAFALADGQIYAHTGLLALLENEAQLAAVLAHESMHVEGHHSILNARQAREKTGAMVFLSIILGDIGNLVNLALLHATIGYGRDLEAEADRRAVDRVLAAGYDPREMPRVFELLDEDPEGERLDRRPSWSDHPQNVARAAGTRVLLEGLAPQIAAAQEGGRTLVVGGEGFDSAVQWCMEDSILGYLDADRPRSATSLARKATARWPDNASAWFLLGESLRGLDARLEAVPEADLSKKAKRQRLKTLERMTRQEREAARRTVPGGEQQLQQNFANAKDAYAKSLALDPGHPGALRGLAYVLDDQGELLEAGRLLAKYLELAPAGDLDRPIAVRRLADITAALRATTP